MDINVYDLMYEAVRYLVLYKKDCPLYIVQFEKDGMVCVYQDIFPINIGNMIGALLKSGNIISAGNEIFGYMQDHDTEGSSCAGISTKESLANELAECYLPALGQIAEICNLA